MITIKTNKDTYYIEKYEGKYLLEKDFPPCCDITFISKHKNLNELFDNLANLITDEDVEDR